MKIMGGGGGVSVHPMTSFSQKAQWVHFVCSVYHIDALSGQPLLWREFLNLECLSSLVQFLFVLKNLSQLKIH